MEQRKIRALIVDDSAFMRLALRKMLESSGDITVVGTAKDGREGVSLARELDPDVITLDIEMPNTDGLQALVELLANGPFPVVMVSSLTVSGADVTLKALDLGAVDFVTKPSSIASADISSISEELVTKVRMAASIGKERVIQILSERRKKVEKSRLLPARWTRRFDLVVIGSSTGGPPALHKIIESLPRNIPCGVLIAQHMPAGFTGFLAERLNQYGELKVNEAKDGDVVSAGNCFVAPAGYQTVVEESGGRIYLRVSVPDPQNPYKPCIDLAMMSVANTVGKKALGILLTGMGADGARGLKAIKDKGGFTIAEAEETCVVYGMPRKAAELGAATRILPLYAIPGELCALL